MRAGAMSDTHRSEMIRAPSENLKDASERASERVSELMGENHAPPPVWTGGLECLPHQLGPVQDRQSVTLVSLDHRARGDFGRFESVE